MRRVLLTAFEETNTRLQSLLAGQVEAISFPVQSFSLLDFDESLLTESYDWLILTSRAAVRFYFESLDKRPDCRKIAVVGEATKEAVESFGRVVDFYPKTNFSAKSLAEELNELLSGKETVLFPCSRLANNDLEESLAVANFQRFEIYQPVRNEAVDLPVYDEIVFCSPSSVKAFIETYDLDALKAKKLYSLGERTSEALSDLSLDFEQAEKSSLESLAETVC